ALHAPWQANRPARLSVVRAGRSDWNESVEAVRDGVRQGRVQKAVLTRDTIVRAKQRLDPASTLWRLAPEPTGSARFAFSPEGRQGPTFVGLTPERLVQLNENLLVTEALAGTSRDEAHQNGADALLGSTKDREEHTHVVRFIMDRLGPLCVELEHGSTDIRKLRHVTHLKTPITGRLSESMHVLDVVRALHPTPAIGGVPLAAAREMIERLEGRSRGWYTGPVGWFDGAGNGDFWVALRSGLVIGERARVFVGAGVVRDSDPDVEWEETLLKERTVLCGLGASA
ncbi:MAG: chorismate-binding protein, partial [Myxococcota bacterium]